MEHATSPADGPATGAAARAAGLPELFAAAPHPDHRDAVMLFGQFVGLWDLEVRFYDEREELVFDGVGLWEFAYTLDGMGVQDTLQYGLPDRFPAPPGGRSIGTTVRAWLPALGVWRQVWVAPRAGNFIPMEAVGTSEGILVTGVDMNGDRLEWTFTEITPTSFEWTGRTSADGRQWRVEQRMRGRRRA
jgi:hypothetical protein